MFTIHSFLLSSVSVSQRAEQERGSVRCSDEDINLAALPAAIKLRNSGVSSW